MGGGLLARIVGLGSNGADGRKSKWGLKEWDRPWNSWEAIPPIFQASLFWAFLCNGPDSAEDMVRLVEAYRFMGTSHDQIFAHEEPRWMCNALIRTWPRIPKSRIFAAVGVFLEMEEKTVEDHFLKRIKNRRRDGSRWVWVAKKEKEISDIDRPFYESNLLRYRTVGGDFLYWLYARVLSRTKQEAIATRSNREIDKLFLESNGIDLEGRFFPLNLGECWSMQKRLNPNGRHVMATYLPYHLPQNTPFHHSQLDVEHFADHYRPDLGPARMKGSNGSPYIGGIEAEVDVFKSLKDGWYSVRKLSSDDRPECQLFYPFTVKQICKLTIKAFILAQTAHQWRPRLDKFVRSRGELCPARKRGRINGRKVILPRGIKMYEMT